MTLYSMIYIGGVLVGAIGPLGTTQGWCEQRNAEIMAGGNPDAVTDGWTLKDIRLACEWHDKRPEISELPPRN